MWNCKCGNTCSDESHFCDKCGAKKPEFENIQDCQWFYYDDKKRVGPLSFDQMKEAIATGKISVDSLVWHQGLDEWKKASETSLHTILAMTVPPVLKKHSNDKWIWCLATIPLLVMYFLYSLVPSYEIYSVITNYTLIDLVVFVLNTLFFIFDLKYLIEARHLDKKMYSFILLIIMFVIPMIVPIYLLTRAIKTNKNFAPAIIWCVLYFPFIFYVLVHFK